MLTYRDAERALSERTPVFTELSSNDEPTRI
jgi:hypothetical protein